MNSHRQKIASVVDPQRRGTSSPGRTEPREKSHMSTRIALVCAAALLVASAGPQLIARANAPVAAAASKIRAATQSGHQSIDGVDYYYELHGAGEPLLLLHGGLDSAGTPGTPWSIDMLGPLLGKLAESRQVIAVDLQG